MAIRCRPAEQARNDGGDKIPAEIQQTHAAPSANDLGCRGQSASITVGVSPRRTNTMPTNSTTTRMPALTARRGAMIAIGGAAMIGTGVLLTTASAAPAPTVELASFAPCRRRGQGHDRRRGRRRRKGGRRLTPSAGRPGEFRPDVIGPERECLLRDTPAITTFSGRWLAPLPRHGRHQPVRRRRRRRPAVVVADPAGRAQRFRRRWRQTVG